MPAPRLILCEKTSRWAVAFRRALADRPAVILETRSLAECGRQLAQSPHSMVAIETTANNLELVIYSLGAWLREFPRARAMGLVDVALASAEPILRELGMQAVLLSPREAPSVAKLVVRHLALAPADELPLREAIFTRLPWPSAAQRAN